MKLYRTQTQISEEGRNLVTFAAHLETTEYMEILQKEKAGEIEVDIK